MPANPCGFITVVRSCVAWTALLAGCLAADAQPAGRPNVVLIIADDLAWNDLGAFGNAAVRTPNLDRLARSGLRFDRAFVTASSCSPSRASLITGRYPHNTDAEQLHWPVPPEQVTFVEQLRSAGYWTGAAGKWHLGDALKSRFDVVDDVGDAGFQTDPKTGTMLAKDDSGAQQWVPLLQRRPKDTPFFLWLAALDPHRDYVEHAVPETHHPASVIVPPYLPDEPAVRRDLALYYDEIARLDGYVGQVVAELERQGITDRTVVMFLSDNGRPFPRDKTTLYDSGIRTPLIVSWPGAVTPSGTTSSLISTVDVAPTVLALAGVQPPASIEGRSFASILSDPGRSIREEIYAEKNWHDFEDRARAVRTPRFKYIRNFYNDLPLTPPADAVRSPSFEALRRLRDAGTITAEQRRVFEAPRPAEELYDTDADPHELRNLAGEAAHASTLKALRVKLEAWQQATGDAAPSVRTPDEFDREAGTPLPTRKRPRLGKKVAAKP